MSVKDFADRLVHQLKELDALTVKDEQNLARAKEQVVRDFIVQSIAELWAAEEGLIVRREDLDAEVDRVRASYPDDLSFRRALAEESLTFEDWRQLLRSKIIHRLISEHLQRELEPPSDAEKRAYYQNHPERFQQPDQVRIRQIVLASESDARAVLDELQRGASFTDLAERFSVAPEAGAGGEVGWVERGTLEVFDRSFSLNPRQRSDILQSPYGYHIIEVQERRRSGTRSYDEVQQEIFLALMENREQAAYSSWLEDQARRRKVFRDDELIHSLIVETRSY